jgi:hypothetical protein
MQATGDSYPATFIFDPPDRVANWRPLVHWLLAIPHLIILSALRAVSQVIAFVSWFIVVFTGRLPADLANFQALYMRYYARTSVYALFMREEYPPFAFGMTTSDPGDDPRVRVEVVPQLEDRNRLTTGFRFILVLPHLLALAVLGIALSVVAVIAFFAVLFTGQWPPGLRNFAVNVLRWWLRVEAYLVLLTDEYPPFALG